MTDVAYLIDSSQETPPVSGNSLLVTTDDGTSLWFDLACW